MALKDEIITLLKQDPVVSLINFKFRSNPIRGDMYRAIGDRIASGQIKVEERKMKKGIEAEYSNKTNTLSFEPGFKLNNLENKGTAIHECTHAILDFHGIGKHDFAENEACAFVAAAVFQMFHNSFPNNHFTSQGKIAEKITLDSAYLVDESDAVDLMIEIRLSDTYRGFKEYNSNDNW